MPRTMPSFHPSSFDEPAHTSLEAHLASVAFEKMMSVSTFMTHVLYDPTHGYYAKKSPIGRESDFITAPEICQIFGELLGLWCVDIWQQMKKEGPASSIRLVEFGPGNGTLMADILRITRKFPAFQDRITVHLIDCAEPLKKRATETLAPFESTVPIFYHNTFDAVPEGPILIIANEFFDALPIDQYIYTKNGTKGQWCHRLIEVIPPDSNTPPSFQFTIGAPLTTGEQNALGLDMTSPSMIVEGAVFEHCPAAEFIWQQICRRIHDQGGAALAIDYGDNLRPWIGDTLQALHRHQKVPLFSHIGDADLTHHVDFARLHDIAIQTQIHSSTLMAQGPFLCNLGLEQRLSQLLAKSCDAEGARLTLAALRLTSPREMGQLFKALTVYSPPLHPAGFSS